ncbi:hypothetical protein BD779DRAFT_441292 [Infundibulicybe gibba]|nr:hypothetical protein BD779DRAFT_441292 [Infundibulicybe gibba]
MPLSEQPLHSIADLVGQFEQQKKRRPSLTPRSLSVSSYITGDPAREEAKEKREWPPKSVESSSVGAFPSSNPPEEGGISPSPVSSLLGEEAHVGSSVSSPQTGSSPLPPISQVATDLEAVPNVGVKIEPATLEASAKEHHDIDHKLDTSITANGTGETLHSESDDRVDADPDGLGCIITSKTDKPTASEPPAAEVIRVGELIPMDRGVLPSRLIPRIPSPHAIRQGQVSSGNEGAHGAQVIRLVPSAFGPHPNNPHQQGFSQPADEASNVTYGFDTSKTALHISPPSPPYFDSYLQSPANPRRTIPSYTEPPPMQANQPFHTLGWTKYLLPDENRYFVHHACRAVTNVDLSDERLLNSVMTYFEGHDDVTVSGQELWLRDTGSREHGFVPLSCLVNHGKQSVAFDSVHEASRDGKPRPVQHGDGDDQLDARYRYWSFMEAHPAHVSLPPNAHQDAIDALDWVSTDWLFPSHRSIPAPFTREECQSLIVLLQSFDKRRKAGAQIPLHTHTVSRVLLEIVRWRQCYFRPNKPLPADAGRDGLCRRGCDRPSRSNAFMLVIGIYTCLAASIVLGPSITIVRVAGVGAVFLSLFLFASNVMAITKCEARAGSDMLSVKHPGITISATDRGL